MPKTVEWSFVIDISTYCISIFWLLKNVKYGCQNRTLGSDMI